MMNGTTKSYESGNKEVKNLSLFLYLSSSFRTNWLRPELV